MSPFRRLLAAAVPALAAAVLIAAPAAPGEPETRVPIAGGRATLPLPNGWIELDPILLGILADQLTVLSGGVTTERYQHGFRPEDRIGAAFGPPLVLVQVRDSGRVPYRDVAARGGDLPVPDRPGDFVRGTRPTLRGLEIRQVRFDRSRLAIRAEGVFERPSVPVTEIRSVAYLTSDGTLTVHGYLELPADSTEAAAVDRMLDGVRLGPELLYRPRMAERLAAAALRPSSWYVAAGATVGILLGLLAVGAMRRRHEE